MRVVWVKRTDEGRLKVFSWLRLVGTRRRQCFGEEEKAVVIKSSGLVMLTRSILRHSVEIEEGSGREKGVLDPLLHYYVRNT